MYAQNVDEWKSWDFGALEPFLSRQIVKYRRKSSW